MRILGIDPGTQITGYGIVEKRGQNLVHIDNGGIFTRSQDEFALKLRTIFEGIIELIERHRPDAVCIENIFYAKNVKSTIKLGHARGAAMVAAVTKEIKVFEYTPLTVKQAVVGYGRASKDQIQSMVKSLLKLPESTFYDSSDALAVAICHLHTIKLTNQIAQRMKNA